MARNDYRDLGQNGAATEKTSKETRGCMPLGLIKSSLGSLARCCWNPGHEDSQTPSDPFEKKYVHTPTHAASSFLKTTTTRNMQSANEIL